MRRMQPPARRTCDPRCVPHLRRQLGAVRGARSVRSEPALGVVDCGETRAGRKRDAPPGAGANRGTRVSAAAKILDRLERVKQTGPGRWLARCPAHEDRAPSLSIRELDGGRMLLHDFGGCETGSVLAALGLTLADLFEKPLGNFAPSHSKVPARDLLEIISEETSVVAIVAADLLAKKSITEADWQRLATAAARIARARDHAYG